jgi:hypothetical protein|uniref:Uncharacterized protein n=1 Tax=Oryza glumipatula TaxID=40148 RepID=A0A0D9ZH12_9ORYZ
MGTLGICHHVCISVCKVCQHCIGFLAPEKNASNPFYPAHPLSIPDSRCSSHDSLQRAQCEKPHCPAMQIQGIVRHIFPLQSFTINTDQLGLCTSYSSINSVHTQVVLYLSSISKQSTWCRKHHELLWKQLFW